MKLNQIKILIDDLRSRLDSEYHSSYYASDNSRAEYDNILLLCHPFIREHKFFIESSIGHRKIDVIRRALDYIELLIKLKQEEKSVEEEGIFLNTAKEQLKQATIAFNNEDYSGVSNKLNTCIELALKDVLEIPTTFKGIKVSNLIDIMISEDIGPIPYLEEVRKYVLIDNLVKHQGMSPIEVRAGMAIAASENLLKKLPKEPIPLSDKTKEKIWKGLKIKEK